MSAGKRDTDLVLVGKEVYEAFKTYQLGFSEDITIWVADTKQIIISVTKEFEQNHLSKIYVDYIFENGKRVCVTFPKELFDNDRQLYKMLINHYNQMVNSLV